MTETLRGKNCSADFCKNKYENRCSFEVAAHDLGMGTTYLEPAASQIGKKESIRILHGCLEECLMGLNTADMDRKSLRNWQSMQAFQSGTGLRMNIIRHRCCRSVNHPGALWRSCRKKACVYGGCPL